MYIFWLPTAYIYWIRNFFDFFLKHWWLKVPKTLLFWHFDKENKNQPIKTLRFRNHIKKSRSEIFWHLESIFPSRSRILVQKFAMSISILKQWCLFWLWPPKSWGPWLWFWYHQKALDKKPLCPFVLSSFHKLFCTHRANCYLILNNFYCWKFIFKNI